MQIKTPVKYHLTLERMAIIKKTAKNKCWRGCREKGALYTVGAKVNWYTQYEEQYGGFLNNYK